MRLLCCQYQGAIPLGFRLQVRNLYNVQYGLRCVGFDAGPATILKDLAYVGRVIQFYTKVHSSYEPWEINDLNHASFFKCEHRLRELMFSAAGLCFKVHEAMFPHGNGDRASRRPQELLDKL